jgi:hypothetical protein
MAVLVLPSFATALALRLALILPRRWSSQDLGASADQPCMSDASIAPESRTRAPRRAYGRPMGLLFKGAYFVCLGVQVSETGMLVAIDLAMTKGECALLTLILPGGGSVVTRGEVVNFRSKGDSGLPEFGFKFTEIKISDRRQIRNYVSAKTRLEAEAESERSRRSQKAGA